MPPPIGFVLLVNPHNPLSQTERLIGKLNAMFGFPPISCHHDFSQNPDFIACLPPNVSLVHPHVKTRWADFSCIEAAVAAIRLLYAKKDGPEWFVYLSGADYPIKSAARILADLAASPFDAHIEHLLVDNRPTEKAQSASTKSPGFKGDDWQKQCYRRFCSVRMTIPWITKKLRWTTRTFRFSHPFFTRGRLPFTKNFECYAGEAWWCANREAARSILDFYDRDEKFAAHCRTILVPEECYFQTVLANDRSLQLSQNCLRYVDWTKPGSHPKVLTEMDLSQMSNSDAHFARKFDPAMEPSFLQKLNELSAGL